MRTLLRGLALALLLWLVACDAPLFEPESITVPSTTAPPTCRGNGRNACPPDPVLPKFDSSTVHPVNASLEVGMTLPYWPIGWYAGASRTRALQTGTCPSVGFASMLHGSGRLPAPCGRR